MRTFYCKNFQGHYPVGTCAIIVAPDRLSAEKLLEEELYKSKLSQRSDWTPVIVEVPLTTPHCNILLDGDY